MNRNPVKISLSDWEQFGEGFTAESFNSKTDDTVMLKLYNASFPAKMPLEELLVSENVALLGLPVPAPIEFVESSENGQPRYGAIFERLQNKRSFARILSQEPDRLEELTGLWLDLSRKLHTTPCKTDIFPSAVDRFHNAVDKNAILSTSEKQKIHAFIDSVPAANTCLHGDWHIGNVLMANQKIMMIDLGDFSYGNPLFDAGFLFFNAFFPDDALCQNLYHISREMMRAFWDRTQDGHTFDELAPFGALVALHFMNQGGYRPELEQCVREWLVAKL